MTLSPAAGFTNSPELSSSTGQSNSATSALRSVVFSGSVPLAIKLATQELPTNADLTVDTFYVQPARHSYLPIILTQIRQQFLRLVLDDSAYAGLNEGQCWFEGPDSAPLRWHWPIGLLYDYHTLPPTTSPSSHWDGLPGASSSAKAPFTITLHIRDPPQDKLLIGPSLDACKNTFMHMLKEADYVRWGTVKRVTNLRKEQQDALWDGLVTNDFDKYWTVASKLVPLPSGPSSRAPTPHGGSSQPADGRLPDANAMRSVPLRVYLPRGALVLQTVVPPLTNGEPTTLRSHLELHLPLLFPPGGAGKAEAVVQGVRVPLETEVGWLGACLVGVDGWVGVVLVL